MLCYCYCYVGITDIYAKEKKHDNAHPIDGKQESITVAKAAAKVCRESNMDSRLYEYANRIFYQRYNYMIANREKCCRSYSSK